MSLSRKTIAGALAAVALGAAVISTSTPASAQWRGGWRGGWGGPVAAGVLGGLALGAIAGAARAPYYYYPPAAYYGPQPGYYYPGCRYEQQPIYNRWGGFLGYRPVRVCY